MGKDPETMSYKKRVKEAVRTNVTGLDMVAPRKNRKLAPG